LSSTNGSSVTANPTVTTTYSVIVTDGNGCQATDTTTLFVSGCTNIAPVNAANEIHVYPNPANDKLTIAAEWGESRNAVLELRNVTGEIVLVIERGKVKGSYEVEIDISFLEAGIYFLDAKVDGERVVKKIIKN
jgi:hypothetical protein